jgi:hypothetical protein
VQGPKTFYALPCKQIMAMNKRSSLFSPAKVRGGGKVLEQIDLFT